MKGMRLDNTATFPIFKYLQIFSFSDGTIETFFFEGQKTNRPIIWEFERKKEELSISEFERNEEMMTCRNLLPINE
jgi:hypothetical protein